MNFLYYFDATIKSVIHWIFTLLTIRRTGRLRCCNLYSPDRQIIAKFE